MTQNPAMMVPADERTSDPWNSSALIHHLLVSTSMDINAISDLQRRELAILEMVREMALAFSQCYPEYIIYDRYYRGNPPLAQEPLRLTQKYKELLHMGVSNWLGLVVDVVDERLVISSVRSTEDSMQDKTAWRWWQSNNMDGVSAQIHNAALRYGLCYASVWPIDGKDYPKIMGESPLTTYVQFDDDENAISALRIYTEACCPGQIFADLTLPDYQFRLVTEHNTAPMARENYSPWMDEGIFAVIDFTNAKWAFRADVEPVAVNPLGLVPYVRLRTMPDLMGGYRSEMSGLEPIADRINKTLFDRLMVQEFAAFPQRWVTGIEVPIDPDNGKPREPYNAAVDRIWTASDPETKMGQFPAADLKPYIDAITSDVQALATQSRTPPHYLIAGMGQFPSGESVRATEYGLTRKCQARQQSYGDGWQRLLHLCAVVMDDQRLIDDIELNVVWKDVEARSEGELVDALLKMGSLNVPVEALWQRWGAVPAEVRDWQAQQAKLAENLKTTQDPKAALLPSIDVALPTYNVLQQKGEVPPAPPSGYRSAVRDNQK